MAEWKQLINEWITEYDSLQENEIKSFAAEHEHNHEISTALFNLFYSEDDSETSSCSKQSDPPTEEMLENVCTQLFSFYRSKEVELQRFTLQFLPILIYNYLSCVSQGNLKYCRCIETLLIGLYNFEVVDESGKPRVVSFRLPSLAQPSIYHEPLSLGPQFLTENALRRWEECNTKLVTWGPFAQVEVLNAQNRLKVMSALLFIYNRQLSLLPKLALRHFCIAASRIVTHGFSKKIGTSNTRKPTPRIPVTASFLLEMIEGAYFAMFNEFYTLALQAVKDIDQRAQYELLPEVMLVTSAVINSLKNSSSGQPCDGPMGISVALSPATTTVTMSKSMITNASFRTKKLPDDIPIQAGQVVPTDSTDVLTCITEEGESDSTPMQRGGLARASKPKLSSFPVLGKKTKESKDKSAAAVEKKVTLKDSSKAIWNSLSGGGGDMIDGQQKMSSDLDTNGSMKDDKISMSSVQNSTENSDSRSQVTSDSLDIDTTPRFAAMQVSSV